MSTNSDVLAQALQAALATADPVRLKELQDTLQTYRSTYSRTMDSLSPFAVKLVAAIDQAH